MTTYTPQSFAALLDGREYTEEISEAEELIAKESGLVVCFGQSDDLLELRGAICEEYSACEGTLIYIVEGKALTYPEFKNDLIALGKYGHNLIPDIIIEAIWCPESLDASWLIEVEGVQVFPFESVSFDIMEDDMLYCRGAVFKL